MGADRNLRKNALIGLGISAGLFLIIAGLAWWLLRPGGPWGEPGPADGGGAAAADPIAAAGREPGAAAAGAAEPGEAKDAEETPAAEAREERPPLLTGRVLGEEGGIEGARVLLFSVARVEEVLRRFERFDPGSGMPDIPALIAAVKQELEAFRAEGKEARSGEDGVYAYFELRPSAYFVLAIADGYIFRYGDVVRIDPGRTEVLDLPLDRGASIGGRVVDGSGTGIPGAVVTAEYRPPGMAGVGKIVQKLLGYINGEFLKGPFQARSDAEGRFLVDSLPPGIYDLLAEKEGWPEARLASVATGTVEAAILLLPGSDVEALLVDGFGLPVPGVRAVLAPEGQGFALPFPGAAEMAGIVERLLEEPKLDSVSAENGLLRYSNVGAGRYKLEIKEAGFLPLERPVEIPGGEALSLGAIRLDSGASIAGRVVSTRGLPVAGAAVSAFPEGMSFFNMGGTVSDMTTGRNRTESDAAGIFRLGGLAPGKYRVLAQARGYGGSLETGVAAGGDPLELRLEPGMPIFGRVIDAATGEAIAGASVRAGGIAGKTGADGKFLLEGVAARGENLDPFGNLGGGPGGRGGRGGGPGRGRPRPGAEGAAGTGAGAEGAPESDEPAIRVRAASPGYLDGNARVPVSQAGLEALIALRLKPAVHAVVLDPAGDPLPGALARLIPGDAGNPFLQQGLIFTDAGVSNLEGKLVLDAPTDEGQISLLVTHVMYAPALKAALWPLQHGPESPVEVRMVRGGAVRGVVTDGTNGVPGARVLLARAREVSPQERFFSGLLGLPKEGDATYTSSAGEFIYERVAPGEYVLTADNAGFSDARSETILVVEGETREVRLVLDPGGEIAGEVLDQDGIPLPGARVRALREGGADAEMLRIQGMLGGGFKSAPAGEAGQFILQGLPDGAYRVIADKAGYSPAEVSGVRPGDGKPIQLFLAAAARLRGAVADAATGFPIPRFELRVAPADGEGAAAGAGPFSGRFRPWQEARDSEGRFFRDGLAAGRYRVEVRAETYLPAAREVTLFPGGEEAVSFLLPRAGRLAGRVLDAETGLPIAGARIGLAPERVGPGNQGAGENSSAPPTDDPRAAVQEFFEEMALGQSVTTGDDGAYALDSFPEGARTVVATHDEYVQEHRRDVAVGLGQELALDLRLRRGRSVSGMVRDAAGAAAPGSFLLIRGAGPENRAVRKATQAGPEGRFRFGGIESGAYTIIAPGRGGRSLPASLTIEVGDADLDGLTLVLPAAQ